MKTKLKFIIILKLLSFCLSIQAQEYFDQNVIYKDYSHLKPSLNGKNIFRSIENNYSIQIPQGWSIENGGNNGVEFIATHPDKLATINICVGILKNKIYTDAHSIPVNKLIHSLIYNIPSFKLIDTQKLYLSNEPCLLIKSKYNYKTINFSLNMVQYQYFCQRKGSKSFVITCLVNEKYDNSTYSTFLKCINSFVFEDFEEKKSNNSKNKIIINNSDSSHFYFWAPIFVFSLCFLIVLIFDRRKVTKKN